ncbi:MAG: TadE/TadG family type IV pilus assembly protein [Acetobacteraceae bacterium]|jgi:Flp pilus assembly protein TadG
MRRLLSAAAGSVTLAGHRRGVIAIMFALLMVPLIIVVALSVDFSFYIVSQAQLNLAADAAAMHAVRVASQYYVDNSTTVAAAEAQGITAGKQWFAAQAGNLASATVPNTGITVNVTYLPPPGGFSATVSYAGTVATHLGSFIRPNWNISNTTVAQSNNQYLEVVMMLDNSSSMQIGATTNDMQLLMQLTPCYSLNATYSGVTQPLNTVAVYSGYTCSGGGNSYDGGLSCPLPVPSPPFNYSTLPTSTLSPGTVAGGPSCQGLLPVQANGKYPLAGPPCAFACHSDNSVPAGQGQDFYGLARSTIGTANPITLRFDLLKQATNELLNTMSTANTISGNLSVGIFSFNNSLTQVYPASGEAGSDFTSAIAAVGAAPTVANGPDTGIQPDAFVTNNVHADTDFPGTMTTLSTTVTASGNGAIPSTPRKVLILITDGYENYDNGNVTGAFDVSQCTTFKNMGYTVYVVYTPYQPLMWYWYYTSQQSVVEGTGPGSLSGNLQQCASSSSDYITASDGPSLTAALQAFLKSAMDAPGRVAN